MPGFYGNRRKNHFVKTSDMGDEFENFLRKVDEIGSIVHRLKSDNEREYLSAMRQADIYLHTNEGKEFDEDGMYTKTNKTVINKKALREPSSPEQMSAEAFMAITEKDARERAEDRRQRKDRSDALKLKANKAFRENDFVKALDLYNKAIEETRDSGVLYTNRAATCLRLELFSQVLSDCEWAHKLNEDNLKAWLMKAKAHYFLNQPEESAQSIEEARKRHPDQLESISAYIAEWNQQGDPRRTE